MSTRSRTAGARTRGRPAGAGRRGRLAPGKEARGLEAAQVAIALDSEHVGDLATLVRAAGGAAIGAYQEPLGGRPLLLASLPLNAVQPTPFRRDLSPTHAKRLAAKIDETAAFLDPLIVVRGDDGRLWTPNGRHRLAAAKVLGMKQITALISPDESLAYRILALNTEKAHNLRDRSLEVIRMARNLARNRARERESQFAAQFEAPELLTLGIVYEKWPRFAGGAYSSFLKKVDRFSDQTPAVSLRQRSDSAAGLALGQLRQLAVVLVGEPVAVREERRLAGPAVHRRHARRARPREGQPAREVVAHRPARCAEQHLGDAAAFRATAALGENAQSSPVTRTSRAVISSMPRMSAGSRVAPGPMLCGKIVAPGMLLWPCTASVPHRRGIPEEPPAPSETS